MEPYLPKKILWRRKKMGFPFAFARFFADHRSAIEPFVDRAVRHGFCDAVTDDYGALGRQELVRLWRICSTGIWADRPAQWARNAAVEGAPV